MQMSTGNLSVLFTEFKNAFNQALESAQSYYKDVSMIVPSSTAISNYSFLTNFPHMREWAGSRTINHLGSKSFQIENRNWEQTVAVDRNDIEDDRYGFYAPIMRDMGIAAATHPDELIFSLLGEGFINPCLDGQPFFSKEHPQSPYNSGSTAVVSNVFGSGENAPWFLLDCSRPIRPLIFQNRRPPVFVQKTQPTDDGVFYRNQNLYGADARYNVGYGLWQLAFACTDPLTPYNYSVVRAAMMSQKSESGRPLGVRPTHLVTVPGNEGVALRLLRAENINATTNEWNGTVTPIITQYLLGASNATDTWGDVADFLSTGGSWKAGAGTTADGNPPSGT
ncbi:mu-like prophage major head subunit gpT [Acetobacter aceti NRIC 0242]|uniref:Head protein n=1 Tax=Acetobacter aceti NBRC 14818 TaxID=887700 RepID=A0AB33ILL1_ACEAC|nr:Mu-like prophage major head subunit gpT family protein [Acetobacter aceti]TCS27244.1 phage major head subunit gpT-like protein [Acetobacter aceti NBRC 14818]BCK77765.1 head protein [Acetobacter aceti NBRC 14818]GBO82004.1 mu-like prophage major head subunit gpT [Acetobacter aceti NRIC 0242]